mgnify:CR=1 FL=1
MSEAAIQSFLGDLAKDEGLQAQVRELLPAHPGKPEVSTAILAVARRSGFDVDAGDAAIVESVLVEAPRNEDGELDEAALEQVAGGFGFATAGFFMIGLKGLGDTVSNTFTAIFSKG